jgi:hypothetical protein
VPDQSLLTDDVRALIGVPRDMGVVQITPRVFGRALDVYLGSHPEPPPDGTPVPGYVIEALDPDVDAPQPPSLMPNSLLISNEWQFERQLRMGETLKVASRLVDVSERFGGRFGYSIDFRSEVEYSDATGAVVARTVRTMTQYSAADARESEQS